MSKINLRDTETEQSCLKCKWFLSYQDYYEDNLEPHDSGYCQLDNEINCNDSTICDLIEPQKN